MNPTFQGLELSPTPSAMVLGISFVVLIATLSFLAAHRSGFRRNILLLESLRVLIAAAIAATLLQPEWKQTFLPQHKPALAVLVDSSDSMETLDITDLESPSGSTYPTSRAELAAPLAEDGTWSPLADRFDVIVGTFNSKLPEHPEKATDLQSTLHALPDKYPKLGAVVLVSDGDWNTGGPPALAATRLRMAEIPVFAVAVGSPEALPDIDLISFEAPIFAVAGKPVRIPFTLRSTLPRDEPVVLELSSSEAGATSTTHRVLAPAMESIQDTILWHPRASGEVSLTLSVPATGGETYTDNNSISATVDVRQEQLRVLVLETYPRWEYRYLRNALQRDPGVEVDCLLLHPDINLRGGGSGYLDAFPGQAALSSYDVVFLGDIGLAPGQLTSAQTDALRNLVRDQASGLVFLPGLHGFQHTLLDSELGQLIPVVLDPQQPRGWGTPSPGRFVLTEAGTRSLLTRLEDDDKASALAWSQLPGFHWHASAMRAKVGTETLATHGTQTTRFGRVPLIVTRTFGAGKILFMGSDAAWRWRKGIEDRYHYRFWGQVVRWMAYQRNMASGDRMRLFYSPDRPRANETLTLNANVMSDTGEPLRGGNVIAEITSPQGTISSLQLAPAGQDSWGLFTGSFTASEGGTHHLRLSCAQSGTPLEIDIPVQATTIEQRGRPARPEVLAEIAQLTRGKLLPSADLADAVAAVAALPDPSPEIRRLPLWAHPAWAGTILLLLALFWILRKRSGMF